MPVVVRPYEASDWDRLCDIHDRARKDELRGSVDPAAFLPLVDTAESEGLFDGEVWVAADADRVVGFVALANDEITWLYVDPDVYRRGIGRRLLRCAVARCGPTVTTEALGGNAAAIALYESEGFEIVETVAGKLEGNERFATTGVRMRLDKTSRPVPQPGPGVAEVNGTRLAYELRGAGHPLVLLHAGIADARMWDDQMDAFAERFLVLRYDARGFGRSGPARGPYSPTADLAALLAHLGIGRAHLLGLSMGGALALDAALEHPALASALVLAAARPSGLAPSQALRDAWAQVDDLVEAGDIAAAVELENRMWVDGPGRTTETVDPAIRERVREMNAPLFAQPDEGEPQPLDPPAVGRLHEVAVPTLVIVGDRDQPDVLAGAEALAAGIPGARRAVIPNTAHVPNMERPSEFNRLVLEFLTDVRPS